MTDKPLNQLSAAEVVRLLHDGAITAEALVRACLGRIAADEPRVLAWQFLDPELALEQARRIDRASPRPLLAGLPVGIKDVMDTADMPTEYGSVIHRGHRPTADAALVGALRRSGAVILGKTVSTEFATYSPGKTRNPHDPAHTPGGSSSGSAAAVADAMAPVAFGTQTAGSIIRPAAFCGVIGFKPSYGVLPMTGVFPASESLDTLGFFARDLDDVPLVMRALGAPFDSATLRSGRTEGADRAPRSGQTDEVDRPPRVGLCRTEQWPRATPEAQSLVEESAAALARAGARVVERDLPADFTGLAGLHDTVMAVEVARVHRGRPHPELLTNHLRAYVAKGAAIGPGEYQAALDRAESCRKALPRVFDDVDVLLTPSTPGEAPRGLETTGDPAMNRIWTLLHVPCIHLPISTGPAGLPLGVQLVGPEGADGALVAAARWIWSRLR